MGSQHLHYICPSSNNKWHIRTLSAYTIHTYSFPNSVLINLRPHLHQETYMFHFKQWRKLFPLDSPMVF